MEVQHGAHVNRHGAAGRTVDRLGVALAPVLPLGRGPALRQVAVDGVVRGGLVGDHVRPHAAPDELRKHIGGIAEQADRDRLAIAAGRLDDGERLVERIGAPVEIAGLQAHLDAARLTFHREHRGAREGRGKRLGAAHAAEAAGEDPAPCEIAAIMAAPDLDEGLVGALHDALAADVDPGAGRHLAVHH